MHTPTCVHGRPHGHLCPHCGPTARDLAEAYSGPRCATPGPTHAEELARDRRKRGFCAGVTVHVSDDEPDGQCTHVSDFYTWAIGLQREGRPARARRLSPADWAAVRASGQYFGPVVTLPAIDDQGRSA